MIISQAEVDSLVQVRNRCPHQLLGMHRLGEKKGVVVRAFHPGASSVDVEPVHDKTKPSISLIRIHDSGLFEGVSKEAREVYAYDLVVADREGSEWGNPLPPVCWANAVFR